MRQSLFLLGMFLTACAHSASPLVPAVDAQPLQAQLRVIVEQYPGRDASHPETLKALSQYLQAQLHTGKADVDFQPYRAHGLEYRNVIAHYGPQDKTKPAIVIGAHYDAAQGLPAADDNASGVVALLALAKLLETAQQQPGLLTTPIVLVAYPLEEPPNFRTENMGSAHHAQLLKSQGTPVKWMMSVEMIGTFSDAENSQDYPLGFLQWLYPNRGNFIALVGRFDETFLLRRLRRAMRSASALPVEALAAPKSVEGLDFSDHLNYWAAGYPAVMLTDTAFLRNPRYHTAEDTPERLDYPKMAQVIQGIYAAILAEQ